MTNTSIDYFPHSPTEKFLFDELWQQAKPVDGVISGIAAVTFLQSSGLDVHLLRTIWSLCCPGLSMNISQFYTALRYIALVQSGVGSTPGSTLSREQLQNTMTMQIGPPKFNLPGLSSAGTSSGSVPMGSTSGGLSLSTPMTAATAGATTIDAGASTPARPASATPSTSGAAGATYSMTPADHLKYHQLFLQYDTNMDGYLSMAEGQEILLKSGLPLDRMLFIYDLADVDRDGKLSSKEFCAAFHLILCVMKRKLPIPVSLPPALRNFMDKAPAIPMPIPVASAAPTPVTAPPVAAASLTIAPVSAATAATANATASQPSPVFQSSASSFTPTVASEATLEPKRTVIDDYHSSASAAAVSSSSAADVDVPTEHEVSQAVSSVRSNVNEALKVNNSSIESTATAVALLKSLLQRLHEQQVSLTATLSSNKKYQDDAVQQLEHTTQEVMQVATKLSELQHQIAVVQSSNTSVTNRLSEKQLEKERLLIELNELQKSYAKLVSQVSYSQDEAQTTSNEQAREESRSRQLQGSIHEQQATNTALLTEIDQLSALRDFLRDSQAKTQRSLDAITSKHKETTTSLTQTRQKNIEYEHKLMLVQQEQAQLKGQIASLLQQIQLDKTGADVTNGISISTSGSRAGPVIASLVIASAEQQQSSREHTPTSPTSASLAASSSMFQNLRKPATSSAPLSARDGDSDSDTEAGQGRASSNSSVIAAAAAVLQDHDDAAVDLSQSGYEEFHDEIEDSTIEFGFETIYPGHPPASAVASAAAESTSTTVATATATVAADPTVVEVKEPAASSTAAENHTGANDFTAEFETSELSAAGATNVADAFSSSAVNFDAFGDGSSASVPATAAAVTASFDDIPFDASFDTFGDGATTTAAATGAAAVDALPDNDGFATGFDAFGASEPFAADVTAAPVTSKGTGFESDFDTFGKDTPAASATEAKASDAPAPVAHASAATSVTIAATITTTMAPEADAFAASFDAFGATSNLPAGDAFAAGFDDAFAPASHDSAAATGFDDAFAASQDSAAATGFNDAFAASQDSAASAGFDDAFAASQDSAASAGFDDFAASSAATAAASSARTANASTNDVFSAAFSTSGDDLFTTTTTSTSPSASLATAGGHGSSDATFSAFDSFGESSFPTDSLTIAPATAAAVAAATASAAHHAAHSTPARSTFPSAPAVTPATATATPLTATAAFPAFDSFDISAAKLNFDDAFAAKPADLSNATASASGSGFDTSAFPPVSDAAFAAFDNPFDAIGAGPAIGAVAASAADGFSSTVSNPFDSVPTGSVSGFDDAFAPSPSTPNGKPAANAFNDAW